MAKPTKPSPPSLQESPMRNWCLVPMVAFLLSLLPWETSADDFKLEPDFTLLFNGKNLDGWKTKENESLDGKTSAYGTRMVVKDGVLEFENKKENRYIYTQKEFG